MIVFARNEVVAHQCRQRSLNRRRPAEAIARADVGRQQFAAVLDHHGAQHRALREGQPLPDRLEHRLLLGEQAPQRLMQVVERRATSAARAHFVPRLVREALDVVRQVAGEIDDRGAEPRLGLEPGSREACVDEVGELAGRDLVEAHDWAGLVERPLRPEHPLHEARLGSREDVADVALMLHGGTHRVLDRAAIESGDCLEFVERDHELPPARRCEARRQREHLLRQARDVAVGPDVRKRHGEIAER